MNNLFMDSQVNQYGSHMIMTGTRKATRNIYVNIDTKFRDVLNNTKLSDYIITLPEKINNVHSIEVISVEIPKSIYNISSSIGNNKIIVSNTNNTKKELITLNDGFYKSAYEIINTINTEIDNLEINSEFDLSASMINSSNIYRCIITNKSNDNILNINFNSNFGSQNELISVRNSLGWKLGFRNVNYEININETLSGESIIDVHSPKYIFLAIDDYVQGSNNSVLSPFNKGIMNKNIIARIIVPDVIKNYGEIINGSIINGSMVSLNRTYNGNGSDLQKLKVQLVDEFGSIIDLNKMDYSFILKIEVE